MSDTIQLLLAIVRLGDADHLGWWRSHGADDVAEFVLGNALPGTWRAAGIELAMESARLRHEQSLERSTQVHLFSDYLPYHRLLRDWLIERKLERDTEKLAWLQEATTEDLLGHLPAAELGEKRAGGLYLGQAARSNLTDDGESGTALTKLAGAYAALNGEFVAPYLDVVDS